MRCVAALLLQLAALSCVHACAVINFGTIQFILPHKNGTRQEIEVNKGIMNLFPAAYHIFKFFFPDDHPPKIPAKPVTTNLCKESDGQSIFCGPGGKKPTPNRPFSYWKTKSTTSKPPTKSLAVKKYTWLPADTKSAKPKQLETVPTSKQ